MEDASQQYRAALGSLCAQFGLRAVQNPGGAAFEHPQWGQCQVYQQDDREDFEKLCSWLNSKQQHYDIVAAQVATHPVESIGAVFYNGKLVPAESYLVVDLRRAMVCFLWPAKEQ